MNNGSLRCSLTKQDLDNNGVKLEDFFTNNKTARDFLEKLIHMAEKEVGYKTSGNMMSIQAAAMSEDNIILTFTEHQLNGSDLIDKIRNMVTDKTAEVDTMPDKADDIFPEINDSESTDEQDYSYILKFDSLDMIVRFAAVMITKDNKLDKVISTVYKYKDEYYMHANLNFASREYLYSFVSAGMEYAKSIQKDDNVFILFLQEHGKTIVGPWAMQELGCL